jgi:hypothetical protein
MSATELLRLVPDAPAAVGRILDPARGPLEQPNRSEIFGPERFAQHGRSLGDTHAARFAAKGSTAFFPRLRDNLRILREAHRYIGHQATFGYDVSPAAEWLLDNFHLIEAQLREIDDGLPRRYFRDLPVLQESRWSACRASTASPGPSSPTPTARSTRSCWSTSSRPTRRRARSRSASSGPCRPPCGWS